MLNLLEKLRHGPPPPADGLADLSEIPQTRRVICGLSSLRYDHKDGADRKQYPSLDLLGKATTEAPGGGLRPFLRSGRSIGWTFLLSVHRIRFSWSKGRKLRTPLSCGFPATLSLPHSVGNGSGHSGLEPSFGIAWSPSGPTLMKPGITMPRK